MVYKHSKQQGDHCQFGQYTTSAANSSGNWSNSTGFKP